MKTSDSLQDFAYEEIKKRIQNGEYAPGTKLNTQEISDSLGISRSPVLAAINRLIALGLVEATPRKGTTVAQLSDTQIRNIIEARQMMELFCVKLCIRNIEYHPSIIKEMETVVQEFETALEAGYPAAAELETDEVSLIPKTIDDIRNFADEYNAPETVESVFRWDVSDFFYNYFFAGNYITVGGSCGDDSSRINIYNQDAVYGLAAYQKLSQFFSIDAATSSYDQVVQDFLDGKLVYTIATTDILDRVVQAKADGSFAWEYGVASLPDISETVCSRGISVTGSIVVNGYGKHQDEADNFAAWLCTDSADKLFDRSTLVPAKKSAAQQTEEMAAFWQEYSQTVPVPKLMATANFWVQMEIAETKIWEGENVSDVLKDLSEKIMTQVTGTQYVEEEYIEVPTETQIDYAEGEEE